MNDFSFFHMIILIYIKEFLEYINDCFFFNKRIIYNFDHIIIFILSFIEFVIYLIFLEVIQLNCCGLNYFIKKNIERRAIEEVYHENRFNDLDDILDEFPEDNEYKEKIEI